MSDSEIFITGANGQLGQALQAKYPGAKKAGHSELDITNKEAVLKYDWSGIKYIINAAAYTDVDGAQTSQGKEDAMKINAKAVEHLAEVAAKNDLTLAHISTDYVFDGSMTPHTEDEQLSPISEYGKSKAKGDKAASQATKHYILRTSWLIGDGKNFVRTMLELGKKGIEPTVVADQIGRLTFTSELVKAIDLLIKNTPEYGTYNVSNGGEPASWADITREVFKDAGFNLQVTDTTTAEYFAGKENIAPRPLNSVLDLSKIESLGFIPKDWHEGLAEYINKELQSHYSDAAQGASEE
jgi:dTDP-4-dehydrorhamnose reductase